MGYKVHSVDGVAGEVSLLHARKRTVSQVFLTTSAATYAIFKMPVAATVTAVRAYRAGGSAAAINAAGADGNFLAVALVSTTDSWASSTTIQNASVDAGDAITVSIAAPAGSPTAITIEVDYTVDVPA
jgi:hypothetical protein